MDQLTYNYVYLHIECRNLQEATLHGSVGIEAFEYCTSLQKVTIVDVCEKINSGAFYGCGNLTEVRLPVSLTTIDWGAFQETNLRKVIYDGESSEFFWISIDTPNDPLMEAINNQNGRSFSCKDILSERENDQFQPGESGSCGTSVTWEYDRSNHTRYITPSSSPLISLSAFCCRSSPSSPCLFC